MYACVHCACVCAACMSNAGSWRAQQKGKAASEKPKNNNNNNNLNSSQVEINIMPKKHTHTLQQQQQRQQIRIQMKCENVDPSFIFWGFACLCLSSCCRFPPSPFPSHSLCLSHSLIATEALNSLDTPTVCSISINMPNFLCFLPQGHRQGWRTEQHFPHQHWDNVHGSSDSFHTAPQAASSGAGQSWCAGCPGQGCQHGHCRVPASVPQSSLELLDTQFPAWQKSLWQNRRSR